MGKSKSSFGRKGLGGGSRSLLYSTYFYNHLFICIRNRCVRLGLASVDRHRDPQHELFSFFLLGERVILYLVCVYIIYILHLKFPA